MDRLMGRPEYTFGTSATAASRLEEIARYFNPLAADLIQRFVSASCDIAVDIGCGPGFTTDMLAAAANCQKTYGLDKSREFLQIATRQFAHCRFLEHDVTQVPFPLTADVMYARFVLCHLREPLKLIARWITQLNPGGLLFVDEIDAIDTDLEVFKTYLAMAEGIVATQGACLYVGKALGAAHEANALVNESVVLPVTNCQAASWFLPNTQTIWNENEYVLEHLSPKERDAVRSELDRLKTTRDSRSDITWRLRRLVLHTQAG
jgi:trans-aconitate 2-methyltransferase